MEKDVKSKECACKNRKSTTYNGETGKRKCNACGKLVTMVWERKK